MTKVGTPADDHVYSNPGQDEHIPDQKGPALGGQNN